jgi:hypothetical protein
MSTVTNDHVMRSSMVSNGVHTGIGQFESGAVMIGCMQLKQCAVNGRSFTLCDKQHIVNCRFLLSIIELYASAQAYLCDVNQIHRRPFRFGLTITNLIRVGSDRR